MKGATQTELVMRKKGELEEGRKNEEQVPTVLLMSHTIIGQGD